MIKNRSNILKRRRENSIKATDSTVPISAISITKQYLTTVRISLTPQKPVAPIQVPLIQLIRDTRKDLTSPSRIALGKSLKISDPSEYYN